MRQLIGKYENKIREEIEMLIKNRMEYAFVDDTYKLSIDIVSAYKIIRRKQK